MLSDPVANILLFLPKKLRICLVIFGAFVINLSLGSYLTFGNMLPYMSSYIQNITDPNIHFEQLTWINTFQGCFPFAMVIGGFLSEKLGFRLAAIIGCAIMTSGVFLSHFTISKNFYLFMFTYGLMYGLGQGIAYVVAISCVISWAPKMSGFGSGVTAAGFGISSTIFSPLQTLLINPKNYAPDKNGYFTQPDLINHIPGVFLFLSIIFAVMQIIGLIFICSPPSKLSISKTSITPSENSIEKDINSNIILVTPKKETDFTPKQMFRCSTFYWLFIALFCCTFYTNLYLVLYKTFGETFIKDDMFLAVALSIGYIIDGISVIGWGILTDKTSFRLTVSISTSCATILMLTLPFTVLGGKFMYLIWLILMFVCMAATHALFMTATTRCFGSKHKTINHGWLIISTTCSGILLAILTMYIFPLVGYTWTFIGASIFPFIAFLLIFFIGYTPQGHMLI